IKKKSDDYIKYGLMVEKLSLDLENMRLKVKEKQSLINKFDDNQKAIEKNKEKAQITKAKLEKLKESLKNLA
ncbi:MAG: hypothetical protein JSW18_00725, partial [Candidatus Omnitrophota bacterium]